MFKSAFLQPLRPLILPSQFQIADKSSSSAPWSEFFGQASWEEQNGEPKAYSSGIFFFSAVLDSQTAWRASFQSSPGKDVPAQNGHNRLQKEGPGYPKPRKQGTHTTTQAYILTLARMLVAGEVTWQQGTNKLQRREDVGWEGHKGLHKTNRDTVLSDAFMKLQIK